MRWAAAAIRVLSTSTGLCEAFEGLSRRPESIPALQALLCLLQVQILVRKVRNKAAGTIGESAKPTAGLC